jgi:hypothetical protein
VGPTDVLPLTPRATGDDLECCRGEIDAIPDITDREVRKAHVGQGRFRQALLGLWGSRCAVTGWGCPRS